MTDQFPSRHAAGYPRTDGHTADALVTPAWVDLADNQPGAAARAQAIARKDAAPIRTMLARLFGVHTEERAWRLGAVGEVKVAAALSKLGPEWRVLHAIPVGTRGADLDHLVIGPGGVFTLNAKHHPGGKLWVADDTFLVTASGIRTFATPDTRQSGRPSCCPLLAGSPSWRPGSSYRWPPMSW